MMRLLLILGALVALLYPLTLSDNEHHTPAIKEAYAYHGEFETGTVAQVTMYTSTPDQTDDTPFITASGQTVRDGIVANNCLAFGTLVTIGDRVYEVQDRKNSRYGCEWFDIWGSDYEEAIQYGVQEHTVSVVVCLEDCPMIEP